MQHDESTNIPFPVRDSLNLLLGTIARDNLLSLESLIQHDDGAVADAISSLRQTSFLEPFLTAFANGREGMAKLKPKQRTGGALAGRIRKDLGITQNPPGRTKVADKACCEALAALKRKHKILALHHVIRGELSALDPAIGDAACEMRPSFLLDIHRRLEGVFRHPGLSRARTAEAIRCYEDRHDEDEVDVCVRAVSDIADDPDDAEDMQLWRKLFDSVTDPADPVDAGTYLQLCKSYTLSSSLTMDEFGLPVACRMRGRYPLTGETSDLEALGHATRSVMLGMAERLVEHERSPDANLAGDILEGLRSCRSYKTVEGARLPLLPIYEALYVILAYEALKERPLLFSVVHLRHGDRGLRLLGTELAAFSPASGTARFTPMDAEISEPVMTFRCLSVTSNGSTTPMPVSRILGQNVREFVLAYAAAHPPFAEGAEVLSPPGPAAVSYPMDNEILWPNGESTRLTDAFARHRQLADRLGLTDFRYSERVDRDTVRRTARPVRLVPIHIHAATMAEERARLGRITRDLDDLEVDRCFDLKKKGSRKRSQQRVFV